MNLDELQISISSKDKASKSLEKLSDSLFVLTHALSGVEGGKLDTLSQGIEQISNAMATYKNSKVTASTFNGLATSLDKMARVNSAGLANLGTSLRNTIAPLEQLSKMTQTATAIKELSKGISTLGNDRVKVATQYLPKLAVALKDFMTVMSTSPKVNDNIINMTNAIASLTKNGQKVGSALNGMNKAMRGSATPISNTSNGVHRLGLHFRSLASSIGMFYVKFFIVIRLFKKFVSMVESAMDYIEAFNFFDVAITNATDDWKKLGYESADSYAKSFESHLSELNEKMSGFAVDVSTGDITTSTMQNLGVNLQKLITFESEIVSITSSLGLSSRAAENTAEAFTMLAADMSSLHNIELDTVFRNFQSGLIGQSRALYKFGLDITNATLTTYALANGVTKSVQAMTQAEKMQLRTLAIFQQLNGQLAQSQNAWGDLANTIEQPANQLRKLQNGFKNLGVLIGRIFLPIITTTLPYLNAMVIVLQRLAESIANFFGISLNADSAATGVTDVLDEMEDEAEDTSDAIAKLNKQLASFDKLNNLTSGNANTSAILDSIDLTDQIAEAVANYKEVWDKAYEGIEDKATKIANRIVSIFNAQGMKGIGDLISKNISNQLKKIQWNKVYASAKNFGSGFAKFLNGLIKPGTFGIVGVTVASALNTAIYTSLSFGTDFDWNNLGESIASGINNFFTTFDFRSLAKTINEFVKGLFTALKTAIANIHWADVYDAFLTVLRNLDVGTVAIIIGAISIKKIGKLKNAIGFKNLLSSTLSKVVVGLPVTIKGIKALFSGGLVNGTSFASKLADSIALTLGGAGTLNESLALNFGSTTTSLAGIGTVIGGLTLSATNFFSQMENGFDGLKTTIMLIGDAFVGLGAVILGANPAIGVALAATLGVVQGYALLMGNEMQKVGQIITDSLTRPDGVPLEDIVKKASDKISDFGNSFTNITEKSKELDGAINNIEKTADSIDLIKLKMDAGVLSTEEGVEKLNAAFKELSDGAKTSFDALENTLLTAFGGESYITKYFESLGYDMDSLRKDIVVNIDNIEKRLDELNDELEKTDPNTERYQELVTEIEKYSSVLSDATDETEDFRKQIASIDYSNFLDDGKLDSSKVRESLSGISSAFKGSETQIEESIEKTREALEKLKKSYELQGLDTSQIDEKINALPKALTSAKEKIKKDADLVVDSIQLDLINNVNDVIDKAEKEWNEMPWYRKMLNGGDMDTYVYDAIQKYQKDVINPMSDEIKQMYEDMGVEGSEWVSDAGKTLLDALVESSYQDSDGRVTVTMKKNYRGIIRDVAEDTEGYARTQGKNIIEAFSDGVQDSTVKNAVLDYLDDFAKDMKKKIPEDLFSNALKLDGETKLKVEFKKNSLLSIKPYETGGFPEDGLFFANHSELVGKFSNGKTAVANNQQITDGIEEAAYRGFMRAMGNSSNTSNVNITLEGDAQGLFKVVKQEANNYQRRTGNPAFGY